MNCDQCEPLLLEYLVDDLSSEQASRVQLHLEACELCRLEVDRLQADFALLADTVEPVEPPAGVRTRLLAAIATSDRDTSLSHGTGEGDSVEEQPPTVPFAMSAALEQPVLVAKHKADGAGWSRGLLWAATLAGVAMGGLVTSAIRQAASHQQLSGQQAEQAAAREQASQELAMTMRAAERLAGQTQLRSASLASEQRPQMAAMLTWDVLSQQLHFHAVGLAEPASGTAYRLWLIDESGEWIDVGQLRKPDSTAQQASALNQDPDPDPDPDSDGVFQLLAKVSPQGHVFRSTALTLTGSGDGENAAGERGKVVARSEFSGK